MGPVATAQQLRDVRAGIDKLAVCARVVLGGVRARRRQRLLRRADAAGVRRPEPERSDPQPRGLRPVCDGDAVRRRGRAAPLVRAGGGGLVSSVYSDDRDFIAVVRDRHRASARPRHDRQRQDRRPGHPARHGAAALIHGGPGRAGGGEELGGLRGLAALHAARRASGRPRARRSRARQTLRRADFGPQPPQQRERFCAARQAEHAIAHAVRLVDRALERANARRARGAHRDEVRRGRGSLEPRVDAPAEIGVTCFVACDRSHRVTNDRVGRARSLPRGQRGAERLAHAAFDRVLDREGAQIPRLGRGRARRARRAPNRRASAPTTLACAVSSFPARRASSTSSSGAPKRASSSATTSNAKTAAASSSAARASVSPRPPASGAQRPAISPRASSWRRPTQPAPQLRMYVSPASPPPRS